MKFIIWAVFALIPFPSQAFSANSAPDSCAKTCLISAECGIGGLCNQGRCEYQNHFCFNERWSVNDRGETSNCDAYSCSADTGLCLSKATSSQDCLSGYVFDGHFACVPSVQCNLADPVCQDLYQRWQKARADFEALTPEPTLAPLSCVACESAQDCGSEQMCWNQRCVAKSAYCFVSGEGENFSVDISEKKSSCGNFICEKVSSQCLTSCLKNTDCRSGKMCVGGTCL